VRPPKFLPCSCNVLPFPVHQSLHPCLLANQLAQLEVEHLFQLICTSSSSPCDTRSMAQRSAIRFALLANLSERISLTSFLKMLQNVKPAIVDIECMRIGLVLPASSCAATGGMFSAASTAAMSNRRNAGTATGEYLPGPRIGGRSFDGAMILLCLWLSVEDVLTGVDMMNE
ncbi:hypothetical protein Tco_0833586, partial [Tanacetum coccineum]